MDIATIRVGFPEGANIIFGQSHFIKTVEDLYEIMISSVPGAQFGVSFSEASGPCLIRNDGNDDALEEAAVGIAQAVGAGHTFAIVMKDCFPINVLNAVKACPEVCRIYCATANPVEVVVAGTAQGRGVLGVIDGSSPAGVEDAEDRKAREGFLRDIGYKR
ncbi:adenosine-specific kinase [bacterium]|nr:adenosine-specific kinase [bacterium]